MALIVAGLADPAIGETLTFFNNHRGAEGSRIEWSSPNGYSCRYQQAERPSVSLGAGVAQSDGVLPGISAGGYNNVAPIVVPPRRLDPAPAVGLILRVPFGGGSDQTCDKLIGIDQAFLALEKARELFDLGLIDKAQLQVIAERAYRQLAR